MCDHLTCPFCAWENPAPADAGTPVYDQLVAERGGVR